METVWRDLGKEMCAALELDNSNVLSIKINIVRDEVVTVEITRIMNTEEFNKLRTIIEEEYMIIPTKSST